MPRALGIITPSGGNMRVHGMDFFRPISAFSFLGRYRIFKNEDAITDPDTLMRFAQYASEGSYDMLYCDDDVLKDGTRTDPT